MCTNLKSKSWSLNLSYLSYYTGQPTDRSKKKFTRVSKSKSKAKKKPGISNKNDEPVLLGSRDTSLFLFRSLGKILYCKSKAATQQVPRYSSNSRDTRTICENCSELSQKHQIKLSF